MSFVPDSVTAVVEHAAPEVSVADALGVHCMANAVVLVLIDG
jgi:hypothetical protein